MLVHGYQVIESVYLPTSEQRQHRFPRSKKKRIRKKWSKDPRNFRPHPVSTIFQVVGERTLYVDPVSFRKLREMIPATVEHPENVP